MCVLDPGKLSDHFAELTDPRRREPTYPLINVVCIALCAVICGADDFVAIAAWGESKKAWLAKFLDLRNGIRHLGSAETRRVREMFLELDHGAARTHPRTSDRHRR
jgi:hypothetical protein